MSSTIFMGLVIAFAVALVLMGIYLVAQLFNNLPPSKGRLNQDLDKMRTELQPWVEKLVPWNQEEMELFSLNQINQTIKKSVATTAKGMFTSIYHEPMMAYAYKKYVSPNLNAILLVRSKKHEFVYRFKKDKIQIMADGEALGTLKEDGILYGTKRGKVLGQIGQNREKLLLPVVVKEREIAHLTNPKLNTQPNPRAFDLLSDEMSEEEEKIFLALGSLEVVSASINKK